MEINVGCRGEQGTSSIFVHVVEGCRGQHEGCRGDFATMSWGTQCLGCRGGVSWRGVVEINVGGRDVVN